MSISPPAPPGSEPRRATSELDALAKTLVADEDSGALQLVAYAGGGIEEANQARRLSLSRALNVRAYLIDHGVRNTRMDVRALGQSRRCGSKPADRVDHPVHPSKSSVTGASG